MLTLSNVLRNTPAISYNIVQARFKTKTHWAKLKKKTGPKYRALNHFDDFYGSVFGKQWEPMREALLRKSKYVAVVNNYGDTKETMDFLANRGAHCLKNLIKIQKEHNHKYSPTTEPQCPQTPVEDHSAKLKEYANRLHSQEISDIYPESGDKPERLEFAEDEVKKTKERIEIPNKTLEQSLAEAVIDESRIIDPSNGNTAEALYQYLPATKLKGMEEWIPDSVHYSYYSKGKDFPLVIEPDTDLIYPEHLKVYTYEMGSDMQKFPEPKRCKTGVFNYYPMDAGSVMAVLALGLVGGERVLDLCAAPGGKALVALQTLLPDVIVCNDISISRSNRIHRIFKDYLFDFETSNRWRERVVFNRLDGRYLVDDMGFDKVLVDVPCTTDRVSATEDENNMFRSDRVRERLRMPELQAQLLANALRLVKVGGVVVYSTCSLSPVQNDGVVHLGLKQAFEAHSIVATIKDMTSSMAALSSTLQLGAGAAAAKYGQLVTPSVDANFGPSYIAKLVRVK